MHIDEVIQQGWGCRRCDGILYGDRHFCDRCQLWTDDPSAKQHDIKADVLEELQKTNIEPKVITFNNASLAKKQEKQRRIKKKREYFLQVEIALAKRIGYHKACILAFLEYWQPFNKEKHNSEGVRISQVRMLEGLPFAGSLRWFKNLIKKMETEGNIKIDRSTKPSTYYRNGAEGSP